MQFISMLLFRTMAPGMGTTLIICAGIAAACAICRCRKCARCKCRDIVCVKRIARCCWDSFDDFDIELLVHEALYDQRSAGLETSVRFRAGSYSVQTDRSRGGNFQQPLNLFVEQGTSVITGELLDDRDCVIAKMTLDPVADVLTKQKNGCFPLEKVHTMKPKGRAVTNPKVKLTMMLDEPEDVETGLLAGVDMSHDCRYQVKLLKPRGSSKKMADLDVLALSCAGPLEFFQGLGATQKVYVGILGPPLQRKYILAIWESQLSMDKQERPLAEAELLRIRSVQPDPARTNTFKVHYIDKNRINQHFAFQRIDRSRDVWVEMLQLLIKQVHAGNDQVKKVKPCNK